MNDKKRVLENYNKAKAAMVMTIYSKLPDNEKNMLIKEFQNILTQLEKDYPEYFENKSN